MFDKSDRIFMAAVVALVISIGFTIFVSHNSGHSSGYEKGVSDTILYHETTGGYPTADWVEQNEDNDFDYPQQILDTLEIYHKGE